MKIEKKLFIPSLIILTVVISLITFNLSLIQGQIESIYSRCISYFGCFFMAVDALCLAFSVYLMFGKYKNVRLGGADCSPEYSTFAWAGMMFTTSCGAWLIVYGFLEPLYCVEQDAFVYADNTIKAYEYGQMYAHFHWGPNAWCIYVPISIAIGYLIYNRKGSSTRVSACVENITGGNKKPFSLVIDIIAICGSIIAPVISIGTGMPLLVSFTQEIFDLGDVDSRYIQMFILLTWVLIFGTSVYLGLAKGIKRLSTFNIAIAFSFVFAFTVGFGIFHFFAAEINSIGLFANNFIRLSTYTDPYGSGLFSNGWTFSYWACYFVYMPMMGVFTAKISKGRTLKEIAFGLLVICSAGCWITLGSFGNYAINAQQTGKVDVIKYISTGDEAGAIIALLNTTVTPKAAMIILLVILFIFLATTMDSSAYAVAEMCINMTEKEQTAPRWLRVVWAVVAAVIAFVILQVGGVKTIRALCYLAGLPLAVIAIMIIVSLVKMLKQDK